MLRRFLWILSVFYFGYHTVPALYFLEPSVFDAQISKCLFALCSGAVDWILLRRRIRRPESILANHAMEDKSGAVLCLFFVHVCC